MLDQANRAKGMFYMLILNLSVFHVLHDKMAYKYVQHDFLLFVSFIMPSCSLAFELHTVHIICYNLVCIVFESVVLYVQFFCHHLYCLLAFPFSMLSHYTRGHVYILFSIHSSVCSIYSTIILLDFEMLMFSLRLLVVPLFYYHLNHLWRLDHCSIPYFGLITLKHFVCVFLS